MEEIDLLVQIKRRLEALQSRIESRADPKLVAEVASTIQLADVHLPSVFMHAGAPRAGDHRPRHLPARAAER